MATPEVDRLHAIEPWDPRVNDATTEAVRTVGDKLHLVADLTARAAADLGMNGATAEAVAAELDALTKRVRASADGMHAIAKSRTTVTTAGRHAQDTSKQLQKQLKAIESNFSRVTKLSSGVPMGGALLAQATAERDAKHAELEAHASTELASLDHVAVTEGKGLPFQPEEDSAGRHGPADSDSASGAGGGGRSPHVSASGGASDGGGSVGSVGLPRSATEWRATGLGDAVGSPGHAGQAPAPGYVPGAGSGFGLQGSHYAPQQPSGDHSGAVFGGPARPSGLSSPAVYDPLAAAAATTAGGVIGYKAVQAVRAAKAAPAAPVSSPRAGVRSGAAVRAAPGLRPSGIARGATTAPRATTASASSGSSAPARGGATGAARPAPASPAGRSGVLRGTTTAPRATVPSSGSSASRSPLMRGGATTAPRARTNDPALSRTDGKGSYNRTSSTGSAAKSPTGGQSARQTTGRTPGSPGTRAAGGASAARNGQSRTGRGGPAGRPLAARTANPPRAGETSSERAASRQALDALTGKHTRHDKKKPSSRARRREDKNTSAYEPDRRITFLPAGPHPTNNQ